MFENILNLMISCCCLLLALLILAGIFSYVVLERSLDKRINLLNKYFPNKFKKLNKKPKTKPQTKTTEKNRVEDAEFREVK